MAQDIQILEDNGSKAYRVKDALTPLVGTTAPAVNAKYIGQLFVDTTTPKIYISVATDSVTPADDWKDITFS